MDDAGEVVTTTTAARYVAPGPSGPDPRGLYQLGTLATS